MRFILPTLILSVCMIAINVSIALGGDPEKPALTGEGRWGTSMLLEGEGSGSPDKKGADCYDGSCSGCDDCSKKKSTLGCYGCCTSNCLGNGATGCQDKCDGTVASQLTDIADDPELANAFVGLQIDRLNEGVPWTHQDLVLVEYMVAASSSESVQRLALAAMTDAYSVGLLDPESNVIFLESFEAALVGRNFGLRSTAFALVIDNPIPVNRAHVLPHLIGVIRSGASLDSEIQLARPDARSEEVLLLSDQHRNAATDAIRAIARR